ncbi:MAG: hypothetical protein MUO30_01900 [Anaerolineales bacterium]|nr:hypothetical protein [Anaerolineales bacterium]
MKQSISFIRSFFFVYPIIAMYSRLPGALQPVSAIRLLAGVLIITGVWFTILFLDVTAQSQDACALP